MAISGNDLIVTGAVCRTGTGENTLGPMDLCYRLLNVFTVEGDPFSGNPMAVFEDGSDLSDEQMLKLAAQMNVETTFVIPEDGRNVVRFVSPEGDRNFAGSASIGTAYVLAEDLPEGREGTREVILHETTTGEVPIEHSEAGVWRLQARAAEVIDIRTDPTIVMAMVGLHADSLAAQPARIQSARGGIVIPVRSVDDVRRAKVDSRMLHGYTMLMNSKPQVYVWAADEDETIEGRMFYGPRGGVLEVPATGSGVANLGWWLLRHGEKGLHRTVRQGAAVGRHSIVELDVTEEGNVYIGGRVHGVARGVVTI